MTQAETNTHSPPPVDVEQIEAINDTVFGDTADPVTGITDEVAIAPNLRGLLERPDALVVALEEDGRVDGFSVIIPIGVMDPSRVEESSDTAYVYVTAIKPEEQGKSRVGTLMETVHQQLLQRGYSYLERDANIANGYADSIDKFYGEAVVNRRDHEGYPGTGAERNFRIDLSKLPAAP